MERAIDLDQALFDLTMLTLLGGKERTEGEFRQLLEAAGFGAVTVLSASDTAFSVVEAVRS